MPMIPEFAPAVFRWVTAMFKQFPIMSSMSVLTGMATIVMVIYMATQLITGIPIAVSRIQRHHFSNYVGFPVERRELDAQSISFGEITITNISPKEKVALDFLLHITGPGGVNLKRSADLIGPLGMILGKDDTAATQSANLQFGESPKYFRNSVELQPGQIERKRLEFLFNFVHELRDRFTMIMTHAEV